MEVKIKIKQETINGEVQPKRYDLSIIIHYGTGSIQWQKDAFIHDLDADTIKELIPLLTKELENALKY